jgi:hypothetical protein
VRLIILGKDQVRLGLSLASLLSKSDISIKVINIFNSSLLLLQSKLERSIPASLSG